MENKEVVAANVNSTDPADVVQFTQSIRYMMFDELTENGTKLTNNFKDVSQLLRDMDNSALTQRKLNIDEKAVADGREVLEAHLRLQLMLGGRDPFEASPSSPLPIAERFAAPISENPLLPAVTMVPGEDAQGEQQLSISNYVSDDE